MIVAIFFIEKTYYVKKHSFCKNCRQKNDCECCLHTNQKYCVQHGNCGKCPKTCQCFSGISSNYQTRSRFCEPMELVLDIQEEENLVVYPSYPIQDYGSRETFSDLTKFEWISFQCILFWEFCSQNNVEPTIEDTEEIFFSNILPSNFRKDHILNLFESYSRKEICSENFLISENDSPFKIFVKKLLLTYHRREDDLIFLEFLQKMMQNIDEINPGILNEFGVPPEFFKFAIGSFQSIFNIFDVIKKDVKGSYREKNDLIHKALIFILFSNPHSDVSNTRLEKILNISDYLIKVARSHVENFKKGELKDFDRIYKTRTVFSEKTDNLIQQFWLTYTIPCQGKQSCSTYISKKEGSVKQALRYIPCTVVEFLYAIL